MTLSTHVLDAALGRPAAGVAVRLERRDGEAWSQVATGATGSDGRLAGWLPDGQPAPGVHRLIFDTGSYFAGRGMTAFYPEVTVTFLVAASGEHYHLPLLLSPYAYSTYRGS